MINLYQCQTCKKEVAESAFSCPYCGESDVLFNSSINNLSNEYIKLEKRRRRRILFYWVLAWLTLTFTISGDFPAWFGLLWFIVVFPGAYALLIKILPKSSEMSNIEYRISNFKEAKENLKLP